MREMSSEDKKLFVDFMNKHRKKIEREESDDEDK